MKSKNENMTLFDEVRILSETSDEAFDVFNNIMSRKSSKSKDVLYVCSTLKNSNILFAKIAHDFLGEKINKNKRCIELNNGTKIWVQPISKILSWLPGRKFISIIFER